MADKFTVYIPPEKFCDAFDWCEKEFGVFAKRDRWEVLGNNELGADFYFKNEEDAMAFKMIFY